MSRRLVDCQYFKSCDIAVLHEIIDGERNYEFIKNPSFTFYIEPELKKLKKETKYYKKKEELKKVECKYSDRFGVIANLINFDCLNNNLNEREVQSKIMANHNLYGADDSIEHRLIIDYYNKYKDEIDEAIPLNYVFFDIETHSDFDKNIYSEIEKIYNCLDNLDDYVPDLSKIVMTSFNKIMEEEDIENVAYMIKEIEEKNKLNLFYDFRLIIALVLSKVIKTNKERVMSYIRKRLTKEILDYFYDNIGFPDETKGNNRIDAISFVDTKRRKLYMYLLNISDDLDEDCNNYINDEKYVSKDMKDFVELFMLVSNLTNLDKSLKEQCKDILVDLPELNDLYKKITLNDEEKSRVKILVEKAKNIIPDYEQMIYMDVEYKVFDSELNMLETFFEKIKRDIKPNVMAAHNARFDVNTIKNRLIKYNTSFDYLINQFTEYKEYNRLHSCTSYIKIDTFADSRKQEKTKYKFPGLVMLDTLLMYAKSVQNEKDWSLDSIVREELSDSKIPYEFDITEFYRRDVKKFIKYSSVDTLLLMRLEEKLKFIELMALILSNSKTDWDSHIYRTTFLSNLIKYELKNRKDGVFILRNNLTFLNPKKEKEVGSTKEVAYEGAYNTTLDGVCDTYGFHENLFDLDFSAFYPNCAITTNLCVDQLIFTIEEKEIHNDYIFMSKIAFAKKYLNMPSSEEILKSI